MGEIVSPKPEGRRPKEARNPKSESKELHEIRALEFRRCNISLRNSGFGFRVSFGLRPSGFGFFTTPVPQVAT